jgi:hypothetical protein
VLGPTFPWPDQMAPAFAVHRQSRQWPHIPRGLPKKLGVGQSLEGFLNKVVDRRPGATSKQRKDSIEIANGLVLWDAPQGLHSDAARRRQSGGVGLPELPAVRLAQALLERGEIERLV